MIPGGGNPLLLGDDGYLIQRSLRFRRSASANLGRTLSTNGSATTFTWSSWIKRGVLSDPSNDQWVFAGNNYNTSVNELQFEIVYRIAGSGDDDCLAVNMEWPISGTNSIVKTQARFRDPSAWYHVVVAIDTTQATASNRVKIYINGVLQTAFITASYPSQNQAISINQSGNTPRIGAMNLNGSATRFFDGYLTEVNFIDGQALTPSSFGETDAQTGVWKPKKYAGTYGTNGFFLNFSDNSSTTNLCLDKSGNANNWTPNNISVTAGSNYDSMLDVPTLTSASAANFCVLNAANKSTNATLSNGNLQATGVTTSYAISQATFALTSGKWYFEVQKNSASAQVDGVSMVLPSVSKDASTPAVAGAYSIADANPSQVVTWANGGTNVIVSTTNWANADIIQCAYDADTGKLWYGRNGTWYPATNGGSVGDPAAGTNPTITAVSGLVPALVTYNTSSVLIANFGQRPFSYTPPTGFKALNTFNLPDPSIKAGNKHFDATTYTGNGSTQTITNSGSMQPDLVWIKNRSSASQDHTLVDSVRGIYRTIRSDTTGAELLETGFNVTAFNSNGFQVADNSAGGYNVNGSVGGTFSGASAHVAWQWKANGSAVTNTAGSITSQVSANASAGFSIVTYTGTGANATVGHGLGVAPKMVIVKNRSSAIGWQVRHASVPVTQTLELQDVAAAYNSAVWNNTAPTSSVFSLGTGLSINNNAQTYVAYCFSEVDGYSKFGSYTGNGSSDGPFVYLEFRPKFVMVKRTDSVGNWIIWDTVRNTYNATDYILYPNLSNAEGSGVPIDSLSNGFKIRDTSTSDNASGGTYIFMAFAESPFKNSLAR